MSASCGEGEPHEQTDVSCVEALVDERPSAPNLCDAGRLLRAKLAWLAEAGKMHCIAIGRP